MWRRRELMNSAIDLLAQGRIRPPAPRRFALRDAVNAHHLLATPDALGKIVLVP
jgi:NADPH2:quinone reductase